MADLPESNEWTPGIYQIETSDPVLGGPEGISNQQAKQLASRTRWLKAKIDAFLDGTLSVANALKLATARTISISGAGTGSASFDGSANSAIVLTLANSGVVAGSYAKVTVTAKGLVTAGAALDAADIPSLDWNKITTGKPTTLGGYGITDAAPLLSPQLQGLPTTPTPAQFDKSQLIASTEFVRESLGNMSGYSNLTGSVTIPAASAGEYLIVNNPGTVTLPNPSSLPLGTMFTIEAIGAVATVTCTGASSSSFSGPNVGPPAVSAAISDANVCHFVAVGANYRVFGGSGKAALNGNGYQKLPSGMILQWIFTTTLGSQGALSTWPIAFPNACLFAAVTCSNGNSPASVSIGSKTTTQVGAFASVLPVSIGFIGIGF